MTRLARRRYLALKIDCAEPVESKAVSDALWNAFLRLFGEFGAGQTGSYLVEYDEKKRLGVLRCSHKALPMVRAAIASVTRISSKPAAIHVIRISGTLKALGRKMINST